MRRKELAEIILIGAVIAPIDLRTNSRTQNGDATSLAKSFELEI
jgi:hypothetical protein